MTAKNLITDTVLPLKPGDTGATALGMMDEYRVAHLPIVRNMEFLGVISDADIYSMNSFEDPVGDHPLTKTGTYVHEEDHVYEVIKEFHEHKLTLVPVLSDKGNYLGAITLQAVVSQMATLTAMDNPGGIIVLEVNEKDYSPSEIARIVESNDARLLSLYVNTHPDSTVLEVTLKINRIDIGPILQTFHRYDYIIQASFSDRDTYKEDLQERFDSLMNYLNI
jgi:acetoin utilization protein AcuB